MNWNDAVFLASYGTADQIPPETLPEIVFSGRSNVGKSSLLNRLVGRKQIAKVSSVPGKTATVNFFRVGDRIHLVDLPGYGYAKVSKTEKERWNRLMSGYFSDSRSPALVVQLLDMRHPPTRLDLDMIAFLIEAEFPFLPVLTKADKLSATERENRLAAFGQELPYADQLTLLPVSAKTGEGIDRLREILEEVTED